jgi:hypothetical protein
MEKTIRALNVLSGVILLAAVLHIQATFWSVLSPVIQGLISLTVWLYFFVQIDVYLTDGGNNPDRVWR